MKTLIIGVGAFGFAVLYHIANNNPNTLFYAYEKDEIVLKMLKEKRQNPYFFPNNYVPENVSFLEDLSTLGEFDLIIIAIPAQFIGNFMHLVRDQLKPGVTILNLAKGIDTTTLQTASDIIKHTLSHMNYHYAILSGGMIAGELIDGKMLGAQIASSNTEIAKKLQNMFQSSSLKIELSQDYKNIELFGSLKNIFALYMGYLEGKGYAMSSIGYHFCELYNELPFLLETLGGTKQKNFGEFALGGDLIATCFGNSRNRYFGRLVGEGMSSCDAEKKLKQEKKHAEGYYTLQAISRRIQAPAFPHFQKVLDIFI